MPRPFGLLLGEGTTKNMRGLGFNSTSAGDGGDCIAEMSDGTSAVVPCNSSLQTLSSSQLPSWIWWLVGGVGLFMLMKKR